MSTEHLKVSVLTVVHNRRHLIGETIRSVFAQSFPVFEYIIIDDGSTDGLEEFIKEINDVRIKYFYFERIGVVTRLRNIAIGKASGDYLAFIDSDDLWHENKLKFHVEAAVKNSAVLVLCDNQYFDVDGNRGTPMGEGMQRKNDVFWELTERNQSLAFGSNLFFKNLPKQCFYDENLWLGDHDFILRMSAESKVIYLDKVLNYIRRHPQNMSRQYSVLDIICPLEYNRTLDKLLKSGSISKKKHKEIRAANYVKAGYAYFERRCRRTACLFLFEALKLHCQYRYIKVFLKVIFQQLPAGKEGRN